MFQEVVNIGTQLNDPLGKLFITTVNNSVPEIVNNAMVHHLEVNGSSRLNGTLNIVEASGTVHNANNGSILIDHENNGGASSIVFRSKVNRSSDYGYIQYQDASVVGGGGESARLIIGTQNDGDDHIILLPAGNVGIGIGVTNPSQKLTVDGNILASGTITANSGITTNSLTVFNNISTSSLVVNGNINTNSLSSSSISANSISTAGININANSSIVFGGGGTGRIWCGDTNHGIFITQAGATPTNGNPADELMIRSFSRVSVQARGSGGVFLNFGSTSWSSLSDRRIKDNIRTIEDGYETIKRMRPVEYNYKNTLEKQSYGFIAQEIIEIKPELESISYTDDETFIPFLDEDKKVFSYESEFIIPNLVSAIKTLMLKVELLEGRLEALENL